MNSKHHSTAPQNPGRGFRGVGATRNTRGGSELGIGSDMIQYRLNPVYSIRLKIHGLRQGFAAG